MLMRNRIHAQDATESRERFEFPHVDPADHDARRRPALCRGFLFFRDVYDKNPVRPDYLLNSNLISFMAEACTSAGLGRPSSVAMRSPLDFRRARVVR